MRWPFRSLQVWLSKNNIRTKNKQGKERNTSISTAWHLGPKFTQEPRYHVWEVDAAETSSTKLFLSEYFKRKQLKKWFKYFVRTYMVHQCTEKTEKDSAAAQYLKVAELQMNSYLLNSSNSFVSYFAHCWNEDESWLIHLYGTASGKF